MRFIRRYLGVPCWFDYLSVQGDIQLRNDVTQGTSIIRDVKHVASVEALRQLEGKYGGQTVYLVSYYAGANKGGGVFVWDATSTAADDGGVTIAVAGVATGRWVRLLDGFVTPEMFGARGDGIADDTAAINLAHQIGLPVHYSRKYVIDGFISVVNKPFIMVGGGTITFTQEYAGGLHKFELDGCEVSISNINFNLNRKIDNLFSLIRCNAPKITNCTFKDSSSLPTTTGLRHVFRLTYCPYAIFTSNTFNKIGDVKGASSEVSGQYRCIAFGAGCGDHIVDGNTFFDSFQPTVTAEFDDWVSSGKLYSVNDRVIFLSGGTLLAGGQWGQYRCIQEHQNGTITPLNTAYWVEEQRPIIPTRSGIFSNNMNRLIWDNFYLS